MAAESQELVKIESAPVLSANRKLTSLTVDEMLMVAEGFHRSQVFKNGRDVASKAEIFVVIMAGQELGIGPAAAMAGIRFIEGRPELSANLQLGAMKASGKYDYRAEFGTMQLFDDDGNDVTANYPSPNYCSFTVYQLPDMVEVGTTTFTMHDADRAGLLKPGKNGFPSNYLRYPPNMLLARAGSNASAFFTPDAMMMRTYHTGEINGDVDAPVPHQTGVSADTVQHVQAVIDAEAEDIDLFDPASEEAPKAVEPPPTIAPEDVPEFARTPEEQQAVVTAAQEQLGATDLWGDPVSTTPEPQVETTQQERLATPGQRGLMFVRAKAANVSEERLSEIVNEVAGTPHVDRVPLRLVDTVLLRLSQEGKT